MFIAVEEVTDGVYEPVLEDDTTRHILRMKTWLSEDDAIMDCQDNPRLVHIIDLSMASLT